MSFKEPSPQTLEALAAIAKAIPGSARDSTSLCPALGGRVSGLPSVRRPADVSLPAAGSFPGKHLK